MRRREGGASVFARVGDDRADRFGGAGNVGLEQEEGLEEGDATLGGGEVSDEDRLLPLWTLRGAGSLP
jgi:hypothetical protein